MPWWGYLAVWAIYLLTVLGAAWWSLHRVTITPLGVARRVPDKRTRASRLVLLVVVLVAATPVAQVVNPDATGILIVAGVLAAIAVAFAVAMSFVGRVASWETLGPLVLVTVLAAVLGLILRGADVHAGAVPGRGGRAAPPPGR